RTRSLHGRGYSNRGAGSSLGPATDASLFWCAGAGAVVGQPEPLSHHGRNCRGQFLAQGGAQFRTGPRNGRTWHHVGNQPDVRAVLCLLHGRGFTAAGCVSHFMMFSGEKLNYPVEQAHLMIVIHSLGGGGRSEERRVGKEGRVRSADSG